MIATDAGVTTVGATWLSMSNGVIYVQKTASVPAGLVSEIRTHVRHNVANVPNMSAFLFADHATLTRPGLIVASTPNSGNDLLLTSTGRWLTWPVGYWLAAPATLWLGLRLIGSSSIQLAHETTGGTNSGTYTASDAATYTANAHIYSMHVKVLS